MTVAELIELLKAQDQNLQVGYRKYSEYALMENDDILVKRLCEERDDGWIHDYRSDKPGKLYLIFPGN